MSTSKGPPQQPSAATPPMPTAPPVDLTMMPNMRGGPMVGGEDTAQFVNDLRGIIPATLQRSSWAYSSNLLGMSLLTPRLAEAIRYRFKAHVQLLKMRVPKRKITPDYSIWLDNLLLLGTIQTSRATRPQNESTILSTQTSEVITRPPTHQKKLLGFLG